MKHHLMIGTWTPPGAIFTVAFDDEAYTLELVKRSEIPHDEPISWMAFSHDRKNIYGAGMKKWGSYKVDSPSEITHSTSLPMGGHPKKYPYHVYGNPFYEHAGYINVFTTTQVGSLHENLQNMELSDNSAVHGMVFDADEKYVYSADMWANKIWCHRKGEDGRLALHGSVDAPAPGDHPRWVEIHPSGKYLYVLMEGGNRLCIYVIAEGTSMPVYTHVSYPLIPPGFNDRYPKMFRSDVVFCSSSGRYLFATSRSNSPDLTGYIAAFALGPLGQIERQICLNPTQTSGGHSNAVSPCPWSDEWLALCDDEKGFVEIYRWHEEFLGRVAHLDVKEPGFGMNAIWYD